MELQFECDRVWGDFEGDDPFRRTCEECGHEIYYLSALTREEAREFFRARRGEGQVCVFFEHREFKPIFADDRVRQARLREQQDGVRKLVLAAAIAAPLLVVGCDSPADRPQAVEVTPVVVFGEEPPEDSSNSRPAGALDPAAGRSDPPSKHRQPHGHPPDEPCETELPKIVKAKRAIEAMFDDLFGDDAEKFQRADEAVVAGGFLF